MLLRLRLLIGSLLGGFLLFLALCLGAQNLDDRRSLQLGVGRSAPLPTGFMVGVALAASSFVFLASPLLRERADYNAFWTEGYLDPDFTLSDVMPGYCVSGFFPLLPWRVFPRVGLFVFGQPFPARLRGETVEHGRGAGARHIVWPC